MSESRVKETFFIRKIEVSLSGVYNLLWMKGELKDEIKV